MKCSSLLLTLGLLGALQSPLRAAEFDIGPGYTKQSIEGFTCLVQDEVLKQPKDRFQRMPLDVLAKEFEDMRRVLKAPIFKILQEVPVWVEWDKPNIGSTLAVYYGGTAKSLQREGRDPRMANGVQLLTLRRLCELRPPGAKFQQIILLHEMAHAIHHRLLGWDADEVKSAFKQAVDRKLYEQVTDRMGNKARAYARTNEAEYFAEITCAYLDTCHFYPFNYRDLGGYDPVGFALMEKVYQTPEKFAGRQAKIEIGQPAKAVSVTAPPGTAPAAPVDVFAERDAQLKLDQIKAMIRNGKKAEAREELTKLVQKFRSTQAADEARQLLDSLKTP